MFIYTISINITMKEAENKIFKYAAFISYNCNDVKWGHKLHRKLVKYKFSTTLSHKNRINRRPINPVFFAPYDIQPNDLSEELKSRLRASKNLIVICSPNSAKSEFVGFEIDYFCQLGRQKDIYFFIIDGTPNSNDADECYNPKIKEHGLSGYLGVNINEKVYKSAYLNRERAYIQLITKILGIEFDDIWQRHKRLLIKKLLLMIFTIIAFISILFYVWNSSKSVDVNVELNELSCINDSLPQLENAKVKLFLPNDTLTKTIANINSSVIFPNIPNKYIGSDIRVVFTDSVGLYNAVDTTLILNSDVAINVCRDVNKYGIIKFQLYNPNTSNYIPSCRITINGETTITDDKGEGIIYMSLQKQRTRYSITSDIELQDTVCSGECDSDGIVIFAK